MVEEQIHCCYIIDMRLMMVQLQKCEKVKDLMVIIDSTLVLIHIQEKVNKAWYVGE